MKHLLIIEDDNIDQMAFERFARSFDFPFSYDLVNSIKAAKEALQKNRFDAIVTDFFLGDGTAFEILDLKTELPIVVVTGTGSEEVAVKAMKNGAYDYLIKDVEGNYLTMLSVTVENALQRFKNENELREYQKNLERLVEERTSELVAEIEMRKKAEDLIKISLKEKETLLHEIHHRVKNNMQIMTSLLDMQLSQKDKQTVESVIRESKGCIYAMAAIHESLHQSENLSEVEFSEYVRQLSSLLSQTYMDIPRRVIFNIESPDLKLSISRANPLGLVLNELISNSLKYAFPGDRNGTITIRTRFQNENEIELIVSDDGVGFPDGLDWNNADTLGLRLVKDLVELQLNGSIKLDNTSGARFTITFNL